MNKSDLNRNLFKLRGKLSKNGYDWWWHNFTGINEKTKEEKTFFIEYFIINPAISKSKVILGQKSKESLPSYFMIKCGAWGDNKTQLHNFYPIEDLTIDNKQLNITAHDLLLSEKRIKGSCFVSEETAQKNEYMTDFGSMSWDLTLDKQIAYNVGYGANSFFQKLNAFEMFWHAEGIKTLYEGTVIFNNEKYIIKKETSFGYADKNWGKDFTSPWLWISSCDLYSTKTNKKLENSAVEIGGGKPKIFGIPIPSKILVFVFYEGKEIEMNFSKFWKKSNVSFDFNESNTEAKWIVKASNKDYSIELYLSCLLKDMIFVNYENPKGLKQHNHLLNGGTGKGKLIVKDKKNNLIDEIMISHTGCEYGVY